MKFHLSAILLLGGIIYLLYLLVHGLRSDLSDVRATIEKESFQSVQKNQKRKVTPLPEDTPLDHIINKEIPPEPEEVKPLPQVAPQNTPKPQETNERLDGKDYWCRHIPVVKDKSPIRCAYPDSCYSCRNSDIIPPEVENAVPFCKDGSRSEIYSVECCPTGASDTDIECPDIIDCMHAENVPEGFCSCEGKPNCRYVTIGKKIECACIQE